jgi:hypothetical protein
MKAKDLLKKMFEIDIKGLTNNDISHEAEKRRRWLIYLMLDSGFEIKDWLDDFLPFLKELRKKGDIENQYQKFLEF